MEQLDVLNPQVHQLLEGEAAQAIHCASVFFILEQWTNRKLLHHNIFLTHKERDPTPSTHYQGHMSQQRQFTKDTCLTKDACVMQYCHLALGIFSSGVCSSSLQTTRQLLKMLELDGHLIVRKLLQSKPAGPPRLLSHLINLEKTRNIEHTYRQHYYASVTSASLL